MNNWVVILIAVWLVGGIVSIFTKAPDAFISSCTVSLFIGFAYIILNGGR